MKRLIVALLAMTGLALVPAARGEDTSGSDEPPAGTKVEDSLAIVAGMLAADFGITEQQARTYLQRRAAVGNAYSALEANMPSFDEMYIEYEPHYALVVLSTTGSEAEVRSHLESSGLGAIQPFVEVRRATYRVQELASVIEFVNASLPTSRIAGQVDVETSTVRFWVESESLAISVAKVAAENGRVSMENIVIQTVPPGTEEDANSFGGLDLNLQGDHSPQCTTGFSVEDADGTGPFGVSTAAHCPNALELNSGQDLVWQAGREDGNWDVQWHTTPNYDDQPWVKSGGSHLLVTGRRSRDNQMIGDPVCISRRNDTVDCGVIESKTYDPAAPGFTATFIRVDDGSNDLTIGGDSGGPWWHTPGTPGAHIAYGIHRGHPLSDETDAYYMAQNYITDLGVRVRII
jgi:hypothetical protein